MPKAQVSSAGRLAVTKPHSASAMMPISSVFTPRINAALSNLSASCPAVAENSTKGRM
ncbi:hypothetical protein GALL_459740 [mine drainage metagenome]|uniref:Uncharacterized protein n=1 Tax=mine drainage metagenome TaxID=410659 RepID=A0A1J5Q4K2_9ZZZZ